MRMRCEPPPPTNPKEEAAKPFEYDQWTHYLPAAELRDAVLDADKAPKAPPGLVFGAFGPAAGPSPLVRVLRRNAGGAVGGGAVMPGAVAQEEEVASTKTRLLTVPRIFSLGIAANTAHATKPEIADTLEGIDETLNLRDVFDGLGTAWEGTDARFQLVGLTAFYEQHYVCYCYSQACRDTDPPPLSLSSTHRASLLSSQGAGQWILYDDDTRRLAGRDFDAVKEKCVQGRLHPQLLFYDRRPS